MTEVPYDYDVTSVLARRRECLRVLYNMSSKLLDERFLCLYRLAELEEQIVQLETLPNLGHLLCASTQR
jgi:hypothetical protein